MAGTVSGGLKAAAKNIARNPNYYSIIGKRGAVAYMAKPKEDRKPRGFAADLELASIAGAKGGAKSRRKSKKWTV